MKIKVWEGATLDEATKNLAKGLDNSVGEHVVIVPDRFSLLMENLLLTTLKTKAMFNVSVMGISSLVVNLLSEVGIKNLNIISMSDSLLLTSKAIKNVSDNLNVFKKNNINFCHQVQNAISQLKSSGVKPAELLSLSTSSGKQKKYHDIGLIYNEYENLLNGNLDANGLLDYFNSIMRQSNAIEKYSFYFAEFDSFTHETYELIKTLSYFAKEINIALPKNISQGNGYIYEDDIYQKLKVLSKELNISIEVISPKTSLNMLQEKIVKNLYSFDVEKGEVNGQLTLISSSNAKQQAVAIAKIIKYKVYKGARYNDFSIACGNLDKYAFHFMKVFNSLDIPYFIDESNTADSTLLANFIFKILEVFAKDFSLESLQALASNVIFGSNNKDELCKFIESYNIFGKGRYKKYLAHKEPLFEELITPLEKAETFEEISLIIKNIIEKFKPKYQLILDKLKEMGADKEFNINQQAEEIVLDAVAKITKYNRTERSGIGEYLKQLKLILTFVEVSSVPTYVDAVMIGDATTSYFGEVKSLIIAGGEDLPKINGDNSLLSDDDLTSLSVIRKIEPSIRMINRRNRFKLFNLLCSAKEEIIVGYLELNDEGKKVEVPTYIESLSSIFGQKILRTNLFGQFSNDNDVAIQKLLLSSGGRKLALEERIGINDRFTSSISKVLDIDYMRYVINRHSISQDTKALFFPKNYTKVTQLETYFNCPFKHFVRYGLRLNEFEKFEFDERDIGNLCHKLAEIFVNKYKGNIQNLNDGEIKEFLAIQLDSILKQEEFHVKLEATMDRKSLLNYIYRLAFLMLQKIVYEQTKSSFRPLYTEKNLENVELNYKDKKIKLVGKVDRIDISDNYFRIMDYKTGSVSPILKDLYYGDKLQLFLYERAVSEMINKTPVGTLYFDCRYDYDKVDEVDSILKGLIINDEEVLELFDKDIKFGKSNLIAVSPKAAGGYKGQALIKSSLRNFEDYAVKVSANALSEIEEGYIEAKPDAHSCERCGYKSICLFNKDNGYRKKDRITQEDILEALKK